MREQLKKAMALVLAAVMLLGMAPAAGAASSGDVEIYPYILDELTRPEEEAAPSYADDEFVTVIVELAAPAVLEVDEYAEAFAENSTAFAMSGAASDYREELQDQQARIQQEIAGAAGPALFRYSYTNLINGFAAYVQYGKLDAIRAIEGVSDAYVTLKYDPSLSWDEGDEELDLDDFITLEEYYEIYGADGISLFGVDSEDSGLSAQADTGSISQFGLEAAWERGYTGAGKVAAIFDSGLYAQNQLFQYYDLAALQEKFPELDLKADTEGGTIRTKEGIRNILTANKATMNIFQSTWEDWFHSWEGQYPTALPSGFGADVESKINDGAFYTNDKVPFNVDYANGDFNTWVEPKTVGTCPAFTSVSSHGTHVAGITAGNAGPGKTSALGVAGSAYDAQIFFFKVFKEQDSAGQEGDEDVFAALDDAVTLGVNVFNLSLGIPNGFTTYNNVAQAGYQRAYNSARSAGISIAVSAGNDARETRPGNDLGTNGGYTAILPNNSKVGASTAMFSPYTVASCQGLGYVAWNSANAPLTTATFRDANSTSVMAKPVLTVSLADRNGPDSLGELGLGTLDVVYGGTTAQVKDAAADAYDGKAVIVEPVPQTENGKKTTGYEVIGYAMEKGAAVAIVITPDTDASPLSVSYLQAGLAFGSISKADGETLKTALDVTDAASGGSGSAGNAGTPAAGTGNSEDEAIDTGIDAVDIGNTDVNDTNVSNTGDQDDVNTDENTDIQDDANADVQDDANADVQDDANADVQDDANADVQDDANADVQDDANGDVQDDANADVQDDANGDVQDGANADENAGGELDAQEAAPAPHITVTFTTDENDKPNRNSGEYPDRGPVASTSWGVTDALRLTPDIMSPGGNILSAGVGHPNALATMSGTSMASPNMAGCLLLVQQYVDDLIADGKLTGVTKGTLDYATVVDEIMSSTALPYQPYVSADKEGALMREGETGRQNKFFSPRRQGSGLGQLDKATSTLVYLHSTMDIGYNLLTGESQRSKIELGELGDVNSFDVTFVVENLDDVAHTFDVRACLQTDATYLESSTGRYNIVPREYYGGDIETIGGAVITVKSVGGTAVNSATNINRYSTGGGAASITAPKGSTTVVLTVALPDMANYDKAFVNGMFLEGYVFLKDTTASGAGSKVDLSIPYLGFRGDWNDAPIFDLATAYEDVSGRQVSDLDYPVYHIDNLHTRITAGGKTTDAVLGANQFTGAAVPQFNSTRNVNASMRSYLDTLREDGSLSGDWAAISPNGDSLADTVYAQFGLLRNSKMIGVRILNADKTVLKELGVEYEYFKMLASDGNLSHLVSTTGYDKYDHQLIWDGKGSDGQVVADGQYYFEISGLNEYDYLELVNADAVRTQLNAFITSLHRGGALVDKTGELTSIKNELDRLVEGDAKALLFADENEQRIVMPVKVDTTKPTITAEPLDNNKTWKVTVTDNGSGVQAVGIFYDGERVDVQTVNQIGTTEVTLDLSELAADGIDPDKLSVQAIDYAMNWSDAADSDVAGLVEVSSVTVTPSSTAVRPGTAVTLTAQTAPDNAFAQSYQWYKAASASDTNGAVISGAASSTYVPDTGTVGTSYYYCVVNGTVVSPAAAVTVRQPSSGGGGAGGSSGGGSSSRPTPSATPAPTPAPSASPAPTEPPAPTATPNPPASAFTDTAGHWADTAIQNVVKAGVFTGTGNGTFSPDVTLNRAMFTTVLWRVDGSAPVSGTSSFNDVASGAWYHDAVVWGSSSGVVRGVSDTAFDPDAPITREQMAVMLYRYILANGGSSDNTQTLAGFADGGSVSDWAAEALAWAVANGFLTGKPGNLLDPQGLATRAEAAVIIDRFLSFR